MPLKQFLPFTFCNYNFTCIFRLSHACYMPRSSYPLLGYSNALQYYVYILIVRFPRRQVIESRICDVWIWLFQKSFLKRIHLTKYSPKAYSNFHFFQLLIFHSCIHK
jgi:hypothetical protein